MAEVSFETAFSARGWTVLRNVAGLGELFVMPVIVLASLLPQPELMATMSEENLIPAVFHRQTKTGSYACGAAITGIFTVLISLFVPFSILWDLISLGTLLGFNLTNSSLIMMRYSGASKGNSGNAQSYVWKLLLGLWIFGSVGAYCAWIYVLVPIMNGSVDTSSVLLLIGGAVCFLVPAAIIFEMGNATQGELPNDVFRVWGVPYTTGCGIFVNFMLMATFSVETHLNLFSMFLVFIFLYLCYQVSQKPSQKDDTSASNV